MDFVERIKVIREVGLSERARVSKAAHIFWGYDYYEFWLDDIEKREE